MFQQFILIYLCLLLLLPSTALNCRAGILNGLFIYLKDVVLSFSFIQGTIKAVYKLTLKI